MELERLIHDFAGAFKRVDCSCPPARSHRGDRVYQRGIGPYGERAAVQLVVEELRQLDPAAYSSALTGVQYPGKRQACDLTVGDPFEWVVEAKMARFWGDNGKPDDTAIKDVLSPYPDDRSALTDCEKLAASTFPCRLAILIYGFENEARSLEPVVSAFEHLARRNVRLGGRAESPKVSLVHPVHNSGKIFAWEVLSRTS